jgi:orotate phosphoribosyltransferase
MRQKLSQKEALGKEITEGVRKEGMILTWYKDKPQGWTLAGGMWSPFNINLRSITSTPSLYRRAGEAMGMLVEEAGFAADRRHRLVGIAMAGIPFSDAITLQTGIPSLQTRKLPEGVKRDDEVRRYLMHHGQHALVEGKFEPEDIFGIVDDVATDFGSKEGAILQIRNEARRRRIPVKITDVFVLFDREQGAARKAAEQGYGLHSVIPFTSKGLDWSGFSDIEYDVIRDYQKDPQKYQSAEAKRRIIRMARA